MSIRLEGFDGGIRGHRCLIIGKESDWLAHMNTLESESLYKGRSILVIHEPMRGITAAVSSSIFRKRWDCIFRVRDSFEAQMVATYVANAPKPVRILWIAATGAQEIPRALTSKWERGDITLLAASARAETNGAPRLGSGRSEMLGCEWEVIFFPLHATSATVEKILGMRGTGVRQIAHDIGAHLSEIAAHGAGLVWSNIDETDSRGALYWYDPSEGQKSDKLTNDEVVKMLEEVVSSMRG